MRAVAVRVVSRGHGKTPPNRPVISAPARTVATAVMFPGQGAQYVGMGRDLCSLPEARAVFDEVDAALGHNLSSIMFSGPEAALNATQNTQPALLAHSIALVRLLGSRAPSPHCVLGHSVGEYAALVSAGALALADAARLLRWRGALMQAAAHAAAAAHAEKGAVPAGGPPSFSMHALILRPTGSVDLSSAVARIEAACAEAERAMDLHVSVAAVNAPKQVVISGSSSAARTVVGVLLQDRVVARAVQLPVSVPFHSQTMAPARAALSALLSGRVADAPPPPSPQLASATWALLRAAGVLLPDGTLPPPVVLSTPRAPLVSNVSARAESAPGLIAQLLAEGVVARVRWRDCVAEARARLGVVRFVEIGAGSSLRALTEQCLAGASGGGGAGGISVQSVSTAEEAAAFSSAACPDGDASRQQE